MPEATTTRASARPLAPALRAWTRATYRLVLAALELYQSAMLGC